MLTAMCYNVLCLVKVFFKGYRKTIWLNKVLVQYNTLFQNLVSISRSLLDKDTDYEKQCHYKEPRLKRGAISFWPM